MPKPDRARVGLYLPSVLKRRATKAAEMLGFSLNGWMVMLLEQQVDLVFRLSKQMNEVEGQKDDDGHPKDGGSG